MKITNHQQKILNKSLLLLKDNNRLIIKGSAGVGKTFMVNELIRQINIAPSKKILCSAPTNKAVIILKKKVDNTNDILFITTHSALKLKRTIDYTTGNISFQPSFDTNNPPLKNTNLLIIDEASMLNVLLLKYIEEYATNYDVIVIFIGDNKQLNPINENNSPVFHQDYPEVELTEIIRQKNDNPIINLSNNLPNVNKFIDNYHIINDIKYGYLYSNNKQQVIQTLAKTNGTDELKYLAWTNQEVDSMNFLVRQKIYGNPKKIETGETLVFNKPYKKNKVYYTNEEIKIKSSIIKEKKFTFIMNNKIINKTNTINLKYYLINNLYSDEKGILVIHEDSQKEYKKFIKKLKTRAINKEVNWKNYYQFIEQFADLKYNHAISVHKSQGSTYKQVIVNIKNLKRNKNKIEKNRLIYTAITRASELLILYNY